MPTFEPPACPYSTCAAHRNEPLRFRRKGRYRRRCDGRVVQRFLCLACERRFSTQSFRLDYRLRLPWVTRPIFDDLVSKVTQRQSARIRGISRKVIAHRLRLLGKHCRNFHLAQLARSATKAPLKGTFQLDELETFEADRRLRPITVPVVIARPSYFVIGVGTAEIPARGRLRPAVRERKLAREARFGKRRNGSRQAVEATLQLLAFTAAADTRLIVQTDKKKTYASLLRTLFGARARHEQYDSKLRRDYSNPLFPINHTLALMRDGVSRLVRRSWAASKQRERLESHLWVWLTWRNYVRGITVKAPKTTPAMAIGVDRAPWKRSDLLRWRSPFLELAEVQ